MLRRGVAVDAVRIKNRRKRNNAFKLVDIGSVDDRQNVKMVLAQAIERQMEGVICVQVGHMETLYDSCQRLFSPPIHKGALKGLPVQHAEKVAVVGYRPVSEVTRASLLNGIFNAHVRRQYLRRLLHHLRYGALIDIVLSAAN